MPSVQPIVCWSGLEKRRTIAAGVDADLPAKIKAVVQRGAVVTPIALADLDDNDNYTHLCLEEATPARSVTVKAGVAVDSRGDANPETTIPVTNDPEASPP